jgi:CheY-like chemotaxis protein
MGTRHIALIVEDDPDMAAEMVDLLRAIDHDAVVATTKAEALAKLRQQQFCYILIDLQIKSEVTALRARIESGMTLIEEIRQKYPHFHQNKTTAHLLPIIVVSGQAKDHDSIMHAIKLGATNFKRKPLSLDEKMEEIIRRDLSDCGRRNHEGCAAINEKLAAPCDFTSAESVEVSCSKSGNWIKMNGKEYTFRGASQTQLIRLLHEGHASGHAKLHTKTILKKAGYSDNVDSLYKAFSGSTKPWREVIAFDDGHCWLNVKTPSKR